MINVEEIKTLLTLIEALNCNFHTMPQLRAWATRENREIKNEIKVHIAELQKLIGAA